MPLTIGVIGAGGVGTTLGARLLNKGHKVIYGSRDPTSAKAQEVLSKQPTASVDTVHNATASADVVLLTTPGTPEKSGVEAIAASLGPGIIKKVVIDATNPLTPYPALELPWGNGTSGGEMLQEALPDSFVFKAFNTIGVEHMADPEGLIGERLTMLFAGTREQKDLAATVIEDVGFIPVYVGPIRYSRNLEAIAELWIHLGVPGLTAKAEQWTNRLFHFQTLKK